MNSNSPAIFNDVLGPVMRGPSSSHAAGGARIGDLIRQASEGDPAEVTVLFDPNGSLAESHDGHGTDMGFACGIMGVPLTDPDAGNWRKLLSEKGIRLEYRTEPYGASHPGNHRVIAVAKDGRSFEADAVTSGGGMIELVRLDGYRVSVCGDFDELIIMTGQPNEDREILIKVLQNVPDTEIIKVCRRADAGSESNGGEEWISVEIKLARPFTCEEAERLREAFGACRMYAFAPVLPVRSHAIQKVPFENAAEMLEFNKDKNLEIWELAVEYESARGGWSHEDVFRQALRAVLIMRKALDEGLAGTEYEDRILPAQSHKMVENVDLLVPGDITNTAIRYITAVMEQKSAMGVFIAAPTAGSAGCLPGTLFAVADQLGLSIKDQMKGILAAGLIGVFYAKQATFAAEVGGCQVECGAASGMTAAAVCQMMGGSAEECVDAASFALQGLTGLVCDPVANRVEVPCLNKNIAAGMNAVSSANVILAGYDKVIPLDETIRAMYDIGTKLPLELRCTCGGLGMTPASAAIRERLEKKQ